MPDDLSRAVFEPPATRPVEPPVILAIPCLNEAAHIGGLLDQFAPAAEDLDALIVVADGGSTDGTIDIVAGRAASNPRIRLVHNGKRIQSAAMNLVVDRFGRTARYLIRIDAHGEYPDDYCQVLVAEAEATGAGSVVVAMRTIGEGMFQRGVAAAQNTGIGTGGSGHRIGLTGRWIDHGHHALMTVEAFRSVGGYDETFTHNEDAELDVRLHKAGHRIWMTARTSMIYFPRPTPAGLFRQYLGYGRGRARNVLKHRTLPRVRQLAPLAVAPAVVGLALVPLHWVAAIPAGAWALTCLVAGAAIALRRRTAVEALAGPAAMVMHLAWSTGFWNQLLRSGPWRGSAR